MYISNYIQLYPNRVQFIFTYGYIHRIGWWEILQEAPLFDGKNHGFL